MNYYFLCVTNHKKQIMTMKMTLPESAIQQQCVKWFRVVHSAYAGLLFSIPNEGRRTRANASRMKAQGIVAGAADLVLSVARGGFHALYIEMKSERGRQTENQKRFQNDVEKQGYKYVICRGFNEFTSEITKYLDL